MQCNFFISYHIILYFKFYIKNVTPTGQGLIYAVYKRNTKKKTYICSYFIPVYIPNLGCSFNYMKLEILAFLYLNLKLLNLFRTDFTNLRF